MSYILVVVYPAGAKFDMDYYLKSHMKLVGDIWKPHGLKGWKIADYRDSTDSPYSVQAWLEWESKEAKEKAVALPEAAQIFADIPKFTDSQPALASGGLVGSESF
ncbi:hypothetical protein F5Y17DRAFT_394695 [Xylariaceae sp. FL0594]|nr:hypothetical protein F5Y17DRAFT_394695 [Xylariaceae sp. FL0594]